MADYDPNTELVASKLPCPECGSSDAFAVYSDGHGFCHSGNHPQDTRTYSAQRLQSLGYQFQVEGSSDTARRAATSTVPTTAQTEDLQRTLDKFQFKALGSRKITLVTCKRVGYRVGLHPKSKHKVELCPVHDLRGSLIGIKVRDTGVDGLSKDFTKFGGDISKALIGLHRWGPAHKRNDGKPTFITITEGEHDYMAVDQAMEGKYPVCSLPQGVNSAVKAIGANLETLLTYDRVILGFDQDDAGRAAMEEVIDMFPPGKVWIAAWPLKDASDLMQADRSVDITRLVWQPRPYRPDGMVDARELTEACMAPVVRGIPWPWQGMTDLTYGRRRQETYVFASGTGMGKSDLIAEIVASTLTGKTKEGERYTPEGFALFSFEGGGPAKLKNTIAGKIGGKRFHKAAEDLDPGFEWTEEEKRGVLNYMDTEVWAAGGHLYIYDSRGVADWDQLADKIRYLAKVMGIRHFLLDPLSAMVTESDDTTKLLDRIVLAFTKLMEEVDGTGYLVSHLTRPKDGPTHEEGGQVKLGQMRGANGIGMFCYYAFGMERNQQAETEEERSQSTVRCVKDRHTGDATGHTFRLNYDRFTGSLDEPASSKDTQL